MKVKRLKISKIHGICVIKFAFQNEIFKYQLLLFFSPNTKTYEH